MTKYWWCTLEYISKTLKNFYQELYFYTVKKHFFHVPWSRLRTKFSHFIHNDCEAHPLWLCVNEMKKLLHPNRNCVKCVPSSALGCTGLAQTPPTWPTDVCSLFNLSKALLHITWFLSLHNPKKTVVRNTRTSDTGRN